MSTAIELLSQAVAERPSTQTEYRWEDLLGAMRAVIASPLGWEAERTLLAVTRFDGTLHLNADSETPHSMSPEEMLKSLAIQAIAKWTGPTHLTEMQRVEATATSSVLGSIVRSVMRQIQVTENALSDLETITEVDPQVAPAYEAVGWDDDWSAGPLFSQSKSRAMIPLAIGLERGLSVIRGRPIRKSRPPREFEEVR
ncbi:hypothetical protein [Fimbriiglobus ruber]|uniref:hypothetical protein n=1 Tax=Fimbriiglobus ruber TaxID=1908690 RepID=UPI00137B8D60|nr:hypothetical protein [Fimbriiglobus ruber]